MDAKKLYLVAFSDSKQYTLYADKAEELNVLANIEKELNEYLKTLFPDETFAYFTTPRVTEISEKHIHNYDGYPVLNEEAIDQIKRELKREVKVREEVETMNSDAPQNTVSPKY